MRRLSLVISTHFFKVKDKVCHYHFHILLQGDFLLFIRATAETSEYPVRCWLLKLSWIAIFDGYLKLLQISTSEF